MMRDRTDFNTHFKITVGVNCDRSLLKKIEFFT